MSGKELSVIGITMGDPAGIGPEICLKAILSSEINELCKPVIIGEAVVLKRAAEMIGKPDLRILPIDPERLHEIDSLGIYIVESSKDSSAPYPVGQVSPQGGHAAFTAIKTAIDLAIAGKLDGIVTAPINKESLNLAGHRFAGHTEIFAHFTETDNYAMMLAHGNIRVIHVTTHVALRKACDLITEERVLNVIRLADSTCRKLGINAPRIAVAGLNPHGGEHGLFGTEEIESIIPAIEKGIAERINVTGPMPPDTVFSKALGGYFDIVVAMYHDQGHIPVKMMGFTLKNDGTNEISGINVTLGLPIIRVSVDHGTAFDIAGKNIASCESLVQAITYAARLGL